VKAPNVQTGQRLSNRQILVKRVEMSAGSDPITILEGVKVAVTLLANYFFMPEHHPAHIFC